MTTKTNYKLKKIARIRDKATEKYLEVIEFRTSKDETSRLELPPADVKEYKTFVKELRNAGAILPKKEDDVKALLTSVADLDAPEERVYETQAGWTVDNGAFVLVDGVIGSPAMTIIGVKRKPGCDGRHGQLSTAGKWKGWRDFVATLASHSTTMMLTISAALAAPLLNGRGRQSFTINLSGPSGAGKSMATLAGASVIGTARIDDLASWNITDAALEERLAQFNCSILPIDDLSTMKGTVTEKYRRIRDQAYNVAHGAPKIRHSSFASSQGGQQNGWRVIALTSSEKPIGEIARSAKELRQDGEARRLIDVPAVFDGLKHIFDRADKIPVSETFDEWKAKTFNEIVAGCEANHGMAFRKYIRRLMKDADKLERYVDRRITYFLGKVCEDTDGSIARDVAQKFGLIYAGGMLGIKYGLLPWTKPELRRAITTCYLGARDLLPDEGVATRQGIKALRATLRSLPRIRKSDTATDFGAIDGFRKRRKKSYRYVIRREVFNSLFASEAQRALVMNWLIRKQRITLATTKQSNGAPHPQPKKQQKWPDRKRRRSYEIRWPRRVGNTATTKAK